MGSWILVIFIFEGDSPPPRDHDQFLCLKAIVLPHIHFKLNGLT